MEPGKKLLGRIMFLPSRHFRNALQFFYKHVLEQEWVWVDIVKPLKVQTLPNILTQSEISLLFNATLSGVFNTGQPRNFPFDSRFVMSQKPLPSYTRTRIIVRLRLINKK